MSAGRQAIAAAFLLLIGVQFAGAQTTPADLLPARLNRMFTSVDSTTTPGCVVGAARPGLPPLFRSFGMTDLERPTRNDTATVFEAGSVSKQFIAATVLLLSYTGTLSLDDDVRRFIPELRQTVPVTTIRHLLNHESGLRDYGDIMELSGWPRGSRLYTQQEALSLIARQSGRNFLPGAEYSYSNSNYVVAAVLAERASGQSIDEVSRHLIFAPLGMTQTQWRVDLSRRVPNRAVGWSPDDNNVWKIDMPNENVVGNGGLLTTVPDLLRWQGAFRSEILGATFVADMERAGVLHNGRRTAYALGLEVATERGLRTVSHGGWTAGYKSYVGRIPSHGLAVALLCNAGSLRTDLLGPQLLAIADGDTSVTADDVEPDLGPAADDPARASIAGMYRNERTRQSIVVRSFRDGITINTWVPYRPLSSDRFGSADSTRIIALDRRRDGTVPSLRMILGGVDTVHFARVAAWSPTLSELTAIAGTFRSDDADATWRLELQHDTLFVVRRAQQRDELVPRYRDAFNVPSQGWLVTLERNKSGQVSGLDVGLPRTRTIRYTRMPPRTPARGVSPHR